MAERLSPIDASFLTLDTETTHQAIASFIHLDRPPIPLRLRALVERTVERLPRFRSRVIRDGKLAWAPVDDFDVDDHLELSIDPSIRSLEDLVGAAGRLFSRGLPMNGPLWRVTVISNGIQSGSAALSGLLYTFHHALTDGMGALQAIDLLYSKQADMDMTDAAADERSPSRERDPGAPSVRQSPRVKLSSSFIRLIGDSFGRRAIGALNGTNSPHRQLSIVDVPLGRLRDLKGRLGGSLNDLLLTAVSGAVRLYHSRTGRIPGDQRIVMPVSLRRPSGRLTLGNHLTAVGVRLPVSIGDPLERFAAVKRTIDRIKSDGSFGAYALFGELIAKLPPWLGARLTNVAATRTNFICTNMPGPAQERFVAGAKVYGTYGLAALMRSHGVAFAFISYAQKVCVSLVTDPEIVPHPEALASCFRESIAELERAAPAARARRRSSAADSAACNSAACNSAACNGAACNGAAGDSAASDGAAGDEAATAV